MAGPNWVRATKKERRDDLGDCPTLPEELLALLKAGAMKREEDWVRRFSRSDNGARSVGRPTGQ